MKILEHVEELVFDIVTAAIFVPRTLYEILRRPKEMMHYVSAQGTKPKEARYEDHVPPILFWLILGAAPFLMVLWWKGRSTAAVNPLFVQLFKLEPEKSLLWAALFLLVGPLLVTVALVLSLPGRLERRTLRTLFEQQCYCFALLQLSLSPITILMWSEKPPLALFLVFLPIAIVPLRIVATEQAVLERIHPKGGPRRLVALAGMFSVFIAGLTFIIIAQDHLRPALSGPYDGLSGWVFAFFDAH
jgi:hypothetical protein